MYRFLALYLAIGLMGILLGCSSAPETVSEFRTGAEQLADREYEPLAGHRVGVITNHTAQIDTTHLVDLLHRTDRVDLTAIFGPEHGLRGEAAAGEEVEDGVDQRTGVPIYSLYGERRKPTSEMLAEVDMLVFDIQDIGARFYTYISTMGLSMQAAAEHDIPFVVLDRPNPLGGTYVSGFVLDTTYSSFVGMYPIPIAHGMTIGELARMIKGEGWLSGVDDVELTVLSMEGWKRSDQWPQSAETWNPPSPNIPDLETAFLYPGAAFFEGTTISEGRGTRRPFKNIGAPWANGEKLAEALNERNLPGVQFSSAEFTPRPIPSMDPSPKLEGEELSGILQSISNQRKFRPVETGVHVLHAFYQQVPERQESSFFRPSWLANLAGGTRLERMLRSGESPQTIIDNWAEEVDSFKEKRRTYLLY